jgi:heme/copper-type cytochrome/quinol oxidase subunit 4
LSDVVDVVVNVVGVVGVGVGRYTVGFYLFIKIITDIDSKLSKSIVIYQNIIIIIIFVYYYYY